MMASTKEYRDYVLEQLSLLDNITCKPMMGEYLLYYNGLLFGGIYDDRFLVKIVENNKKYAMQESIPYKNAKPMYLVDDMDNLETLKDIVLDTYEDLKKIQSMTRQSIIIVKMKIILSVKTIIPTVMNRRRMTTTTIPTGMKIR